jgi:hypothetical protein
MPKMAPKKKPEKPEKDFLPRKGDLSAFQLSADIASLEALLGDLKAMGEAMRKDKIDSVNVDGIQKFPRAMDVLKEYSGNVWHALYRARLALGKPTRLPVSNDT